MPTREPVTVGGNRREALAHVSGALTAARVPHFFVPTYIGTPPRFGVLERDRSDALCALRAAADADVWRAVPWQAADGANPVALADLPDDADDAGWRVFRPHTWADSPFELGRESGVLVEFWRETDRGWESRLHNPVACILPAASREPTTVDVAGASYPTLTGLTQPPWDEVTFPVDVVYTWVDGADPEWMRDRDRRLDGLGGAGAVRAEARHDIRFADHGELRYSLRALEQFMPWVRKVFVVTADQRPSWLVADHPRLSVVSHRDILDSGALPTFSSLAIETALHHIDGLADHYLYFNDDVFVGRPLGPRDFFLANGMSKFFPQTRAELDPGPWSADEPPIAGINKRTRDLLVQQFGRRISHHLTHAPHPQQRGVLAEIEDVFPDAVRRTRCSPFRSADDIAMATTLHHYFAFYSGRAVPGSLRYTGVRLGGEDLRDRLREVLRARPQSFCLNDTITDVPSPERRARMIGRFLERYFPEPSSFETSSDDRGV